MYQFAYFACNATPNLSVDTYLCRARLKYSEEKSAVEATQAVIVCWFKTANPGVAFIFLIADWLNPSELLYVLVHTKLYLVLNRQL